MSIEYDIIMDKKLILAKGSGVITGIDVIRHLYALAVDDRYRAPMKKFVDYRTIESIRISLKEAYSIAHNSKACQYIYRREMRFCVADGFSIWQLTHASGTC